MGAVPRSGAIVRLLEERRQPSLPASIPTTLLRARGLAVRQEHRLRIVAPTVEVTPVSSSAELTEFVDFPWNVYAGHPNWTPPPASDVRRLLASRNASWGHAPRALFLARRGREVVGRIAALVDHDGSHRPGERAGAFGCFECRDDREAAAALLGAAEEWLIDHGQSVVRGPFGPTQHHQTGLLVAGHQFPGSNGAPYQPQYYQRLIEACGYEMEQEEITFCMGRSSRPSRRLALLSKRLSKSGTYRIRHADMRRFDDELRLAARLCRETGMNTIAAGAMMEAEFDELADKLRPFVAPELFVFFLRDDEPAGVCLLLPDNAPLLRNLGRNRGLLRALRHIWHRRETHRLRSLLIGFQPEHAHAGLPAIAALHFQRLLRRSTQYDQLEIGGVPCEDRETIEFLAESGARQHKRLRTYKKPLRATTRVP